MLMLPVSMRMARAAGIAIFFGLLCLLEWGIYLQHNEQKAQSRLLALTFASGLRADVDRELNSLLNLTAALDSYLEVKGGRVDADEVNAMLASLYRKSRHVLNFGVAVGYRLTYVYPVEGNEKALGLYYPDIPSQWQAVQNSIRSGAGTLAGPTSLVQGGEGLMYRVPVFVDGHYWGLLSTVIDAPSLFASALPKDLPERYEFAVRGRDGLGAKGEVFQGDPRLFDDPAAVQLRAEMPGGQWIYAVRQQPASWLNSLELALQGLAVFVSAVFGYFVYRLQKNRHDLSLAARIDPLTQLANRREFQELLELTLVRRRKLDRAAFSILFLDLDQFKYINDTYGHRAGDAVLVVVADRLRQVLRADDVISRWGGDELVILLRDATSAEMVNQLVKRARDAVKGPIHFDGHQIQISVAIGVSHFPADGETAEALIRVADERMYKDKQFNLFSVTPP